MIKYKRRKGNKKPKVVDQNCKWLIYNSNYALCKLKKKYIKFKDKLCNKSKDCGFESDDFNNSMVFKLMKKLNND